MPWHISFGIGPFRYRSRTRRKRAPQRAARPATLSRAQQQRQAAEWWKQWPQRAYVGSPYLMSGPVTGHTVTDDGVSFTVYDGGRKAEVVTSGELRDLRDGDVVKLVFDDSGQRVIYAELIWHADGSPGPGAP